MEIGVREQIGDPLELAHDSPEEVNIPMVAAHNEDSLGSFRCVVEEADRVVREFLERALKFSDQILL